MLTLLFVLVQAATGAASSQPCSAPEHRQFDFWIGEWEVRSGEGKLLGFNRITSVLSGCALQEEWTSADARVRGISLNGFDPRDGRWHQAWIDTAPSRLDLAGNLVNGRMVLEQRSPGKDGRNVVQRVTWTPLEDGRIRQLWETSSNEGQSWKTVFDGYYSQRAP